jgi:hypothetical protein
MCHDTLREGSVTCCAKARSKYGRIVPHVAFLDFSERVIYIALL